nr:unnamed protein product [Digitaria exilis]
MDLKDKLFGREVRLLIHHRLLLGWKTVLLDLPRMMAITNPMEPGAAVGNENPQAAEGEGNQRNWLGGILKEVQLVVVGFVASLLPGFQHND